MTRGATFSIEPKQIDIAIKATVKNSDFLMSPFKKLNIFGSISSSAIAFMRIGAFMIAYKADPVLEIIIPM